MTDATCLKDNENELHFQLMGILKSQTVRAATGKQNSDLHDLQMITVFIFNCKGKVKTQNGRVKGLAQESGAGLAVSVKFELVTKDLKAHLSSDPALQIFYLLILEFYYLRTLDTDQMVMVTVLRHVLKAGLPVSELALHGKPGLGQELHSPVDGSVTNTGSLAPDPLQKFVERYMCVCFKKSICDKEALLRRLKPFAFKDFLKFFYLHSCSGFCHNINHT